ncbi:MAG: hypothetical protein AB1742_01905 [bacterium]
MKHAALSTIMIAACLTLNHSARAAAENVRSIQRTTDPIIIEGNKLKNFIGTPIEKIRVYAESNGTLAPIPFQLDERKPDGDLTFPFGPHPSRDNDNGAFDANDELVFMSRDLGGRVSTDLFPAGTGKKAQVTVTDPLTGEKGWAYVLLFKNPPPRSKTDYVSCLNECEEIKALHYENAFAKDAKIGFDKLAITKTGKGSGKNMIDRLKIRASTNTRLINLTISKNENDFTSALIAYIDGPVRVIRRTKNQMFLFWKIPTPASVIDNVYYYNFFLWPTVVDVPFDVGKLLKNCEFRVVTDGHSNSMGRIFVNSNNPGGVVMDGRMSDAEKNLDLSPYKWSVVYGTSEGDTGAWMNRLVYDHSVEAQPMLFYVDDLSVKEPPEREPGYFGAIGYDLKNMETLKAGQWKLTSIMYNIPVYRPGDEAAYLNILDHPVEVTVN